MKMHKFSDGMTVRELKETIKDWSETDLNGESCEVWIETKDGCNGQVHAVYPLNLRKSDSEVCADILLETSV